MINLKTIRLNLKLLVIGLMLFLFNHSFSQQLKVKNYFSITGKKDVIVNVVTQDEMGFLWVGTPDGLFTFDGKTAQKIEFKHNAFNKHITALYIDDTKNTWVGTNDGQVYTIHKNKLDSVKLITDNLNTEKITSFCKLNDKIAIGTYGNGIYILNNIDNRILHYNSLNGLSDDVIYSLVSNKEDAFWCATDAGITEIKNLIKPEFKIISTKEGLPDNIVRNITLSNNKLIVSMQDSGVCFYNLQNQKIEKLEFFSNWTHGTVLNAQSIGTNDLTVCTEKNGIIKINKSKLSIVKYFETILTSNINSAFFDNTGQIWTSSRKGLSQFCSLKFNFIHNLKSEDDKILAVSVDSDNSVWFGNNNGICKIVADGEGQSHIIPIFNQNKYTISCSNTAPDGSIWFGTYGNGLIVINPSNNKLTNLNSSNSDLKNDNISHLYFKNETVLISTLGGGLIESSFKNNGNAYSIKQINRYTEADGIGSDYVYATCVDKKNNLYVATDGEGLQLYENGKFTSLFKRFKLNSNTAYSIVCDDNNNVWCITNANGIIKYDGKSLVSINQKNGLRDEQPQQLVFSNNTIFAISEKGIDKINSQTLSVSYTDVFDGDLEPNLNAAFIHDKKIFSGTNHGLLVFNCEKELLDTLKPTAFIKSFQANYQEINIDSLKEFNHNQNNLTITFDGIWLKNPTKLIFRYQLQGFDNDWIYTDEGKIINYNNLNHGTYIFKLQSKNEEDIWSDELSYEFTILTPIWKRWWFWLITVSIIVFIVYSFVQYRLKNLQKENLVLEQKVNERTFEIEKQSQIIVQKNKDITDSIAYAQKIQHAILPPKNQIETHLPKSFVLYMTKDIVSGDFYWFAHSGEFSIIAAVDCTGHGVPGAFMSLIGHNLLNKIVNESKITNPKDILFELNNGVLETLYKNESESKDGMDAAICKINHTENTIEYAGAMRPLWTVYENELTEIKADKIPIGTKPSERNGIIEFTTHKIDVKKGQVFYIFTDGYADQFGGEKNKKFTTGKFKDLLIKNYTYNFNTQEKNIKQEHLDWKQTNDQVDDILIIGFTI